MSFRHNSTGPREFKDWVQHNAALLRQSGVSPRTYADEHAWRHFIDHGEVPDVSYSTLCDDGLLDPARHWALRDAILSWPGATQSNIFYTLPPHRFPLLWRELDGKLLLAAREDDASGG